MATYAELIYIVLDELKVNTDDSYYTQDHVRFLLNKYRSFLLKQRYSDIRRGIPRINFQTICLNLEILKSIDKCTENILISKEVIPQYLGLAHILGITKIYNTSTEFFYPQIITLIDHNRLPYVGNNKFLKNIIYATIGFDNKLYLKSSNTNFLYLKNINITSIFDNPDDINSNNVELCDKNSAIFPIEESLIPELIQLVVKELIGSIYKPLDKQNNANDELSEINTVKNE